MSLAIVVSGIPASGKTTLAKQLASSLGLPLLDKDDILEALFDSLGIGDAVWRRRLSRASDLILERTARSYAQSGSDIVITSFWKNAALAPMSGTPTEWINEVFSDVIEVHCECDPKIATQRFLERARHEGHLDHTKTHDGLVSEFRTIAACGPVGIGHVIVTNTTVSVHMEEIVGAIRDAVKGINTRVN